MKTDEFKIGDIIHFQAYTDCKPIEAKIVNIEIGNIFNTKDNNRIFYKLSGTIKPLISITSGLSITESYLFHPINSKNCFKN